MNKVKQQPSIPALRKKFQNEIKREIKVMHKNAKTALKSDIDAAYCLCDANFIDRIYVLLLGRKPEPEGFEVFSKNLREGKITRDTLVYAVFKNPEAKTKNIRLPILWLRHIRSKIAGFPVVGYPIRLADGLRSLPKLMLNLTSINIAIKNFESKINSISEKISEMTTTQSSTKAMIDQNISQLQQFQHRIDVMEDQLKVDFHTLITSITDQHTTELHQLHQRTDEFEQQLKSTIETKASTEQVHKAKEQIVAELNQEIRNARNKIDGANINFLANHEFAQLKSDAAGLRDEITLFKRAWFNGQ